MDKINFGHEQKMMYFLFTLRAFERSVFHYEQSTYQETNEKSKEELDDAHVQTKFLLPKGQHNHNDDHFTGSGEFVRATNFVLDVELMKKSSKGSHPARTGKFETLRQIF
jgi:hypothetical protein